MMNIAKTGRWNQRNILLKQFRRKLRHQPDPYLASLSNENFMQFFEEKKHYLFGAPLNLNPIAVDAVFANNEISFKYVDTYGFDYDYTLANYSNELHDEIYRMAINNLVQKFGYPKDLLNINYDPDFPIRGLHFDTERGYLMKIDSFSHVQFGTVYKGLQQVSNWDVVREYSGTLISVDQIYHGDKQTGSTIYQQMDGFSIPFLSLLSVVIEYFVSNNIPYNPGYVYNDVDKATQDVHASGKMHQAIMDDLDRFLPKQPRLETYLNRLLENKKKMFIITNSSYQFVNCGMIHLLGPYWRDLFEVIIVKAKKPKFFIDTQSAFKPFRTINTDTGYYMWDKVKKLEKHGVYAEGNIKSFIDHTNFDGPSVIYFGDHVYNDLMDPVLRYGWRTGAIIPELEREIEICNSETYYRQVTFLLFIESTISSIQKEKGTDRKEIIDRLKAERKQVRNNLKSLFNPYFGSMFRTYHNSTSFSRRMTRYADIYTSSIENLLNYSNDCHFFPRRNSLPHEHGTLSIID